MAKKHRSRRGKAGANTPPGFVRGSTLPGTIGDALGTTTVESAQAAFGTDIGTGAAAAAAMESREVPSDASIFKWAALPQRKPRDRRTRRGKHSRVQWRYDQGAVGKKKKKKKTARKTGNRTKKDDAKLIAMLENLSVNATGQTQVDTAALTGLLAGLKLRGQTQVDAALTGLLAGLKLGSKTSK